jgi:hypothetical protein
MFVLGRRCRRTAGTAGASQVTMHLKVPGTDLSQTHTRRRPSSTGAPSSARAMRARPADRPHRIGLGITGRTVVEHPEGDAGPALALDARCRAHLTGPRVAARRAQRSTAGNDFAVGANPMVVMNIQMKSENMQSAGCEGSPCR